VILTLADGKTVPLTDGSHYDNFPAWSPKGDVIMFISDPAGAFQLFTVRTDGTGVRQLTGMVLESGTPDCQPRRSLAPINSWMLTSSVG
jgi:Tol biopolymer transport system component